MFRIPYNIITGQQISTDDIVTENIIQPSPTLPKPTENEFGSRGYDKQFDGAYAD